MANPESKDILHHSNAFNYGGFETINDKVLREMNERAKSEYLCFPDSTVELTRNKFSIHNWNWAITKDSNYISIKE
jgi:hypothetical protein